MARRSRDLQRILKKMDRLGKEPRQKIVAALMRSADRVADTQRQFAESSRDTGALIKSIHVTAPGETTPPYSQPGGSRTAGETEVIITAGNTAVRYAHLIEYGWSKALAQAFFWPAFRLLRKREEQSIARVGRKILREIWDK